ncbi:hypothetical protein ACFL9T_22520 [Thermodesulfobacteriota bacterium]
MEKLSNPVWDHFKSLIFIVFLAELVLFFMAVIFGRLLGYGMTLRFCFWFGIIIAGCFVLIVLSNVILILLKKIFIKQ